jgi:DUF971 family protein
MKAPQRVELDRQAAALVLHWSEANVQRIGFHTLREACACAGCRRSRIDGKVLHVAPDIAVTDIQPVGYGVQLIFSDGHDRGIFPWIYLEPLPEPAAS